MTRKFFKNYHTARNFSLITLFIAYLFFLVVLAGLFSGCGRFDRDTITVIVSLDGFRWDYPRMYDTPNLQKIAREGVHVQSMTPSFPASTFPMHYTLATGLVPDKHGIIDNSFWDTKRNLRYSMSDSPTRNNPAYYGGESIWITAQNQGVRTANIYWPGSDIPIQDTYPDDYKRWENTPRLSFAQRIDTVAAWLNRPKDKRPRLIMLYFEEPDGVGHRYGPVSEQTGGQVHILDSLIGVLITKIEQSQLAGRINLIVTSDHGMAETNIERMVRIDDYLKTTWYERISGSNPSSVFTREDCRDSVLNALANAEHISAYRKEDIPPHLNYGSNRNIGDVLVIPDCGWQFSNATRSQLGGHGYVPECLDMHVIFYACGPDFKRNYRYSVIHNTDVYPLLAHLLGIKPAPSDGDFERIKDMILTKKYHIN